MGTDAWRRQFPNPALHDVIEAVVDLVAERTADLVTERTATSSIVERVGFSPKEAATYTGLSESTVRRLVTAGTIAAGHFGGRVVIHRAELDRLLLGQAVAS